MAAGSIFFSRHAVDRAAERYGIKLSVPDMRRIYNACMDGKALKIRVGDCYSNTYVMLWNGVRIIPVFRNDILLTFLPSDAIVAGAGLKHRKKRHGAKQQRATSRLVKGRGSERRPPRSMGQILEYEMENA